MSFISFRKHTSIIVPLVMTPRELYIRPLGFFFTPIISRLKEHFNSGWVTLALVNRNPDGRINLSYFGGFLVNPGPTNVAFVIILFHCLAAKESKISHNPLGFSWNTFDLTYTEYLLYLITILKEIPLYIKQNLSKRKTEKKQHLCNKNSNSRSYIAQNLIKLNYKIKS